MGILINEFEKIEAGGRHKFTIASSIAFDASPVFGFFDTSGTGVGSLTATQSSTTHYYGFAAIPSSAGFYSFTWSYGAQSYDQVARGVFEVIQTNVEESDLYCSANDVRNLYKPISKGDTSNDEIDEFIQTTMNEINTKIGHRYSVPFATGVGSFPQVMKDIASNLTLVSMVERVGGKEVPKWIEDRGTRYREMVDNIADGETFLVLSGGTVLEASINAAAAQAHHNLSDYVPTFNTLDSQDQRIDPERQNDEADDM